MTPIRRHGRLLSLMLAMSLAPSLAWATLPAGEIWREELLTHRQGFGTVTGGAGGTLCTVTNLLNTGAGSLRNCVQGPGSAATWVIFSVSGTITLTSHLEMESNKTIDGRGQNITISGFGFRISGKSNIVVHNLTFAVTASAECITSLDDFHNIWFDHLTCSGEADEGMDFVIGAGGVPPFDPWTNVTISWTKFMEPSGEGALLFCIDGDTACEGFATATLHHNWYETHARNPLPQHGTYHSFNNYHDNNATTAQPNRNAIYLSQGDIFECNSCGYPRVECNQDDAGGLNAAITCKVENPWLVTGTETYNEWFPGLMTFVPPYSYTLETANAALRSKITHTTMGAGRVDNPYDYQGLAAPTTLVVKLRMNAGAAAGNTVADSSGNGLNGQRCEGATCPAAGPTWGVGRLLFDGTNDSVRIAHNALLNVTDDITMGMFINLDSTALDMLMDKANSASLIDYAFWHESDGRLCLGGGTTTTPNFLCSTSTLTDLTGDHHVAVVRDAGVVTFYVDGAAIAGGGSMTGAFAVNTYPLWFGTDLGTEVFQGGMWNARLYNGALTAAEVQAWANEGLVLKLMMTENSGSGTVLDTSGHTLNGTRCNVPTCAGAGPTWQVGKLLFDGVDDAVRVADTALLDIADDITLGMFLNFDRTLTEGLLVKSDPAAALAYAIWHEAPGQLCLGGGTTTTPNFLCSTGTLVDLTGNHHVAVVREAGVVTFYVDGAAIAGGGSMTGSFAVNAFPLWIGTDLESATLQGAMWNMRLYNVGLSAAEVAAWAAETGSDSTPPTAPANLRVVSP